MHGCRWEEESHSSAAPWTRNHPSGPTVAPEAPRSGGFSDDGGGSPRTSPCDLCLEAEREAHQGGGARIGQEA